MGHLKYTKYLVDDKFQGDVKFAMDYQKNKCELALGDTDEFERECEILQTMEVIKTARARVTNPITGDKRGDKINFSK